MKKLYLFLTGLMIALGVHAKTQTQVIYTWSSDNNTVTQSGGTAAQENYSTTSVNVKITGGTTGSNWYLYGIALRGKKAYIGSTSSNQNSARIKVTLNSALQKGDKIRIYACTSTTSTTADASIYMKFSTGTYFDAYEGKLYWPTIAGKTQSEVTIPYYDYTVPEAADGSTYFKMTRSATGTVLYITKIEITREVEVKETYDASFTTGYLNTFCYPYTLKQPTDGTKFYTYDGIKDNKIYGTEVTGNLEAGQPYLCIPANSSVTLSRNNMDEEAVTTEGSHNGMYANFGESTKLKGSTYMILTTQGLQYCSATNGNKVKQYGCYFMASEALSANASAKAIPLFNQIDLEDPDEATGINVAETTNGSKVIFNLNGQRVSNMQKGKIYIINGKKVAAK